MKKYIPSLTIPLVMLLSYHDYLRHSQIVVQGTVLTEGTMKPVPDAFVYTVSGEEETLTDKNGNFMINGIPSGRYTVKAHHRKAGVVTKEVEIEWHRNTDVQFVIEIPPTQTAGLQ